MSQNVLSEQPTTDLRKPYKPRHLAATGEIPRVRAAVPPEHARAITAREKVLVPQARPLVGEGPTRLIHVPASHTPALPSRKPGAARLAELWQSALARGLRAIGRAR